VWLLSDLGAAQSTVAPPAAPGGAPANGPA
jgi:hypothetical protein